MAVIRAAHDSNYTVLCNHLLRDKRLSLKAKGLLVLMLSLPNDWKYSVHGLAAICKEGVDSISTVVRELEAAGYGVRRQKRGKNGHMENLEYIIYEDPPRTESGSPGTESPVMVSSDMEMPAE